MEERTTSGRGSGDGCEPTSHVPLRTESGSAPCACGGVYLEKFADLPSAYEALRRAGGLELRGIGTSTGAQYRGTVEGTVLTIRSPEGRTWRISGPIEAEELREFFRRVRWFVPSS